MEFDLFISFFFSFPAVGVTRMHSVLVLFSFLCILFLAKQNGELVFSFDFFFFFLN